MIVPNHLTIVLTWISFKKYSFTSECSGYDYSDLDSEEELDNDQDQSGWQDLPQSGFIGSDYTDDKGEGSGKKSGNQGAADSGKKVGNQGGRNGGKKGGDQGGAESGKKDGKGGDVAPGGKKGGDQPPPISAYGGKKSGDQGSADTSNKDGNAGWSDFVINHAYPKMHDSMTVLGKVVKNMLNTTRHLPNGQ